MIGIAHHHVSVASPFPARVQDETDQSIVAAMGGDANRRAGLETCRAGGKRDADRAWRHMPAVESTLDRRDQMAARRVLMKSLPAPPGVRVRPARGAPSKAVCNTRYGKKRSPVERRSCAETAE
ncbi:MAG TPA: hypothetical protein VM639_09375 [Dongiaceae bacterium]|nr:hypothetical protein [Dongiaceae bacterium]